MVHNALRMMVNEMFIVMPECSEVQKRDQMLRVVLAFLGETANQTPPIPHLILSFLGDELRYLMNLGYLMFIYFFLPVYYNF